MKCPACALELKPVDAGGVLLDACDGGCGGVWFDNFELQKFDEAHENVGTAVFDVAPGPSGAASAGAASGRAVTKAGAAGGAVAKAGAAGGAPKRLCPRCPGQKMRRYFFSVKRAIEVDECPACGGDWLDFEELEKIRGEFKTAEDREGAALTAFGEIFDADLAKARAESQAEVARARKFASMFKLICPSAWIPGKQDGAAF